MNMSIIGWRYVLSSTCGFAAPMIMMTISDLLNLYIRKKKKKKKKGGGWFIALLENKARYIQELELFGALLSRGLLFESNMQYGIS